MGVERPVTVSLQDYLSAHTHKYERWRPVTGQTKTVGEEVVVLTQSSAQLSRMASYSSFNLNKLTKMTFFNLLYLFSVYTVCFYRKALTHLSTPIDRSPFPLHP